MQLGTVYELVPVGGQLQFVRLFHVGKSNLCFEKFIELMSAVHHRTAFGVSLLP
jgi:hypothetical protein